ncbi:3-deoxy-manno-octulosonate cytidylyltransferase, mitochondrial [Vitis vinifera]|uniref:3-deoxy-manno-octulosonate cytidylyltransferase, mitochondrial n=1 Tax=Vitis vinifera TaxID=29760 RepID=A0A438IHB4_VITVI|nr:3-deoxy-manno-octulosonate cytidylyltransferase, mitochondrial [Vitis vinifera]
MSPRLNSSSDPDATTGSWIIRGILAGAAVAGACALVTLRRSVKLRSQVVGIIPARFASSRFEGKPLVPLLGKPMIQRTWERAKLATTLDQLVFQTMGHGCHCVCVEVIMRTADEYDDSSIWILERIRERKGKERKMMEKFLKMNSGTEPSSNISLHASQFLRVVATDDEKIAECCRGFGADVIMTSESCRNGTERCNEALKKLRKNFDIVVNIQGDEPLIEPEIIDGVVKALQAAPDAVFSTAVTSLKPEDASDPNRVKCIVDNRVFSATFRTFMYPSMYEHRSGKVNPHFPYFLHLGIQHASCQHSILSSQSYDAQFLRIYPELSPTPLQLEEDLEQLKVLENGYKMKVIKVDHDAHGVDTPEDVEKIEALMRAQNLS